MKLAAALLAGTAILAAGVPTASASFHLIQVREVYPGAGASAAAEYVELQMGAAGENLVGGEGKILRIFGPDGTETGEAKFPSNVANAANQSTLVLATPLAAAQFNITADAELPPAGTIDPSGGKVCWMNFDCVSWGSFSGSSTQPSAAGTPVLPAGIPDGMAIRRTIEPGCPTLLESSDDHNDSATDFFAAAPNPRPNSVAPTEVPCAGSGPIESAPQTTLTRKPPRRSADQTPTFRFRSSKQGSTFQCRVDRKPFKTCRSPFTTKRLSPGRHSFAVRARDAAGKLDATPATFAFTILRR